MTLVRTTTAQSKERGYETEHGRCPAVVCHPSTFSGHPWNSRARSAVRSSTLAPSCFCRGERRLASALATIRQCWQRLWHGVIDDTNILSWNKDVNGVGHAGTLRFTGPGGARRAAIGRQTRPSTGSQTLGGISGPRCVGSQIFARSVPTVLVSAARRRVVVCTAHYSRSLAAVNRHSRD